MHVHFSLGDAMEWRSRGSAEALLEAKRCFHGLNTRSMRRTECDASAKSVPAVSRDVRAAERIAASARPRARKPVPARGRAHCYARPKELFLLATSAAARVEKEREVRRRRPREQHSAHPSSGGRERETADSERNGGPLMPPEIGRKPWTVCTAEM